MFTFSFFDCLESFLLRILSDPARKLDDECIQFTNRVSGRDARTAYWTPVGSSLPLVDAVTTEGVGTVQHNRLHKEMKDRYS